MVNTKDQSSVGWTRYLLIGLATGLFSGLLGVGGGIIMVPTLVAVGFSRHRANATSLGAILLVALSGAIAFAASGSLDWKVGVVLGIGGLLGSTAGAHLMNRLSGTTLALIFGIMLLVAGLRMVLAGDAGGGEAEANQVTRTVIELLVGTTAGLSSGLAGVGGGVVMVPAMVLLLGIDQHTAEGTSLLAILFTALAATRVNVRNRHVDWRAAAILGGVGAATAPVAAVVAQRIPAGNLARIFGVFLIVVAVQTIVRSRSTSRPDPA